MRGVLNVVVILSILVSGVVPQSDDLSNALNTYRSGYVVPSAAPMNRLFYYTVQGQIPALNFTLFPCYGSLNWYMDVNQTPDPNNRTPACTSNWNANSKRTYCTFLSNNNGTRLYLLAQGQQAWAANPSASAKFDFVLIDTPGFYEQSVPVPGGNGILGGSLLENLKVGEKQEVTLDWTATGNPNDTYHVYRWDNNPIADNSGYLTGSACGIRDFMTPIADAVINSDGEKRTTKIADLNATKEYIFAVIVERSGGYMNSYKMLRVNDAVVSGVSLLVLSICAFAYMFQQLL
jgi:hypothetical protein